MELKIKPLSPKIGKEIPLPSFATPGSAAMDLCACIDEPITLQPHERRLIPNGISIALPGPEYVALIFARGGLASKKGIAMANGVGVIDSDYRGPLMSALINQSDEAYTIAPGDRISQMMIVPVVQPTISMVEELDETSRGEGGFGSTGR